MLPFFSAKRVSWYTRWLFAKSPRLQNRRQCTPSGSICQLQKANGMRKSSLLLNSVTMLVAATHSRMKNAEKKCSPFVSALRVNPRHIDDWSPSSNKPTASKKAFVTVPRTFSAGCKIVRKPRLITSQNNSWQTFVNDFIDLVLKNVCQSNIVGCCRLLFFTLTHFTIIETYWPLCHLFYWSRNIT